ncbi:MAG: hypothetical protein H6745_20540 [Deltaproteobacteria bacterium]|nr:hypothetical protein [Deltaproteobacteria bacterium]
MLSARVGAAGLGALRHRPSGTEVIAVPGGRFVMGYTADDALAVWLAIPMPGDDDDDDIEAGELDHELRRARPAHLVTLRPFLLARRATTQDSLFAAAGLPKKQGVAAAVSALGWRFASEAEWEWMAREGGAVRFVGLPPNAHPLRPTLAPPAREPNGWGFEGS